MPGSEPETLHPRMGKTPGGNEKKEFEPRGTANPQEGQKADREGGLGGSRRRKSRGTSNKEKRAPSDGAESCSCERKRGGGPPRKMIHGNLDRDIRFRVAKWTKRKNRRRKGEKG